MSCSHYEERVEKVELPQLKVNGMAIGEDLLARELQYHPADSYALALEAACRALISAKRPGRPVGDRKSVV